MAAVINRVCMGVVWVFPCLLGQLMKAVLIQRQADLGKSAVAGIGKGLGQILAAVGLPVIAPDGIVPVFIGSVAVKMKLPVIGGMFPQILQQGQNLKGGAGSIEPLGNPV